MTDMSSPIYPNLFYLKVSSEYFWNAQSRAMNVFSFLCLLPAGHMAAICDVFTFCTIIPELFQMAFTLTIYKLFTCTGSSKERQAKEL
jgi:hypothetical protein